MENELAQAYSEVYEILKQIQAKNKLQNKIYL